MGFDNALLFIVGLCLLGIVFVFGDCDFFIFLRMRFRVPDTEDSGRSVSNVTFFEFESLIWFISALLISMSESFFDTVDEFERGLLRNDANQPSSSELRQERSRMEPKRKGTQTVKSHD